MSIENSPASSKSETKFQIEDLNDWLAELYDPKQYNDELIHMWYEFHKYQGFSREEVLSGLKDLGLSAKDVAEVIVICALKGPVRSSAAQLTSGRTLNQLGIPERRRPGQKGLSTGRITAATADLAAYFLKKMNIPKKLNVALPGWLQFPSAGSIKLPRELREQHKEFSKLFSERIGGEFNEDIYLQMEQNAYYDEKLKLF